MFCTKCGNEVEANAIFCTKCGNKIENSNEKIEVNSNDNMEGSITILREKQAYAVAIPVGILVDDKKVANLFIGNKVKVPVKTGKHRITLDFYSGKCVSEVEVSGENPNIKITFNVGVFKPKITGVENI